MSEIKIEYKWKNGALVVLSGETGWGLSIFGDIQKARAANFLNLTEVSEKPNTKVIPERTWDRFLKGLY